MRTLLLVVGIVGGTMPALAQPRPLPLFDDTVVVTASAAEAERDEIPAAVTVIDAEEIEARKAPSLIDLLEAVPGLSLATSGPVGGQTSLFTRGTDSNQTLLLWNGIPLNNPDFGGANWQFLPTDGIERVEVVRGPFSSLYGSDAVGGVIQVFTGYRDGGTLRLEGGENGYLRGGLAAGYDLGAVRFDVTGHSRRGDSEFANGDYDSEELVARLEWAPAHGMTLGVLARANDSETGIPFSSGEPTLKRRIAWEEREVAVPFKAELGAWTVEALASQVDFDNAFRDPEDPFGFTAGDTESRARRLRTVARYRAGDSVAVAFGAEAEEEEVSDSSSFGVNLDGADQSSWAAFTGVNLSLGRLSVDAGARRDDNDRYGSETSFRGGLALALGRAGRVFASYGEAFRAPTLGELFFPFIGNPDLRPERSESYELGVEATPGPWRLELVAFEIEQRDLIDFDFAGYTNVNAQARSRGLEAAAAYAGELASLRLSATYLEAEDLETGLALLRRPEESAGLVLTLTPEPWTLSLAGRYVGSRPDVDPVSFERTTNPSYTRFDLTATYRLSARLAPFVRVENLADEEYAEVLGFPAPGRAVSGGLSVGF